MRKKLFAVIMSVMMMVTFMPAMAFATTADDTWGANYDSYYDDGVTYTNIAKQLDQTTGLITAYAMDKTNKVVATAEYWNLSYMTVEDLKVQTTPTAVYKDFTKSDYSWEDAATLGLFAGGTKSANLKMDITKEAFYKVLNKVGGGDLVVGQTADFDSAQTYSTRTVVTITDGAWVEMPNYNSNDQFNAQEFDLELTPAADTSEPLNPLPDKDLYGTLGKKHIKIAAKTTADIGDTTFLIDGKKPVNPTETDIDLYYDGAEHTFAMKELAGLTATYQVRNYKANTWETVDSVKFKDVDEYWVRAYVKDTKGNDQYFDFYIDVQAQFLKFGFDLNDALATAANPKGICSFNVGSNYNPLDFVSPFVIDTASDKEALAKALAADKEQLMAFFSELYEIKTEAKKYDVETFTATITDKEDLTYLEYNEIYKKYKDLLDNYREPDEFVPSARKTATFHVADEITFTKAPLNKTFKAKNGKLAKKRTFSVKAKAQSGAKVTYKLANGGSRITINKNTGKVTLKKGLKKRTYNVTIYALADTYAGTYANYTVKIKVK